jgi:LmbE family N-acetylglucosaminyl deacetylase
MKKVLIVAHPDDEILFFSSLLEDIDKVIVCYGASNTRAVTKGREVLQAQYPLSNIEWLNLDESDVWDASDWNKPMITSYGLSVNRNKARYRETFDNLCEIFKTKLDSYDVVYTHNPWGEYGHEEHVSLFHAVLSSVRGCNKKLFVSCYASDRSQQLFLMQRHLLQGEIQKRPVPTELCHQIKSLYVKCNCWTWTDTYEWPNSEIFAEVMIESPSRVISKHALTAVVPIMFLSWSFKQSFTKRIASKVLPKSIKSIIKRTIYSR